MPLHILRIAYSGRRRAGDTVWPKRRPATCLAWLAFAGLIWQPATAKEFVAVKHGVICEAPSASEVLTLPDDNSRTHGAAPIAGDLRAAERGGCIDLAPGTRVDVQKRFHNTSIGTVMDLQTGLPKSYVVPNADLQTGETTEKWVDPTPPRTPRPQAGPPPPVASKPQPAAYAVAQSLSIDTDSGGRLELLEDNRVTPEIRNQIWRNGRDVSTVSDQHLAADLQERPLLNARLELLSASGTPVATRDLRFPLASIEPAGLRNRALPIFFLTIDKTAEPGQGVVTEILIPARHSLRPVK